MAIRMHSTEPYQFVSVTDEGEPKTVFIVRPLAQFEYMRIAGVYSEIVGNMVLDSENPESMMKFFASDKADQMRLVFEKFIGSNIIEVQNISDGKGLVNLKDPQKIMASLPPMVVMEMIGDALSRVAVNKEEKGN